MEITVTAKIYIDTDEIIYGGNLNKTSNDDDIRESICAYVGGLDDCEYYLIGETELNCIETEIKKILKERI